MLLRVVIFLLACFWPLVSPTAQEPRRNAADDYRKVFALLDRMREERWNDYVLLTDFVTNPNRTATAEIQAAIRRAVPILDLLRRASSEPSIDWGIDYSQGIATRLPHLSPMRQASQLLAADALVRLEAGDSRGAAEALATGFRMSQHATDDPVLINALVGAAMFSSVNRIVERSIGEGGFAADDARALLDGVNFVTAGGDPLGFTAAIEGEREGFSKWLIDNFTGEGGRERFLEMGVVGFDDPAATAYADMTQAEFDAAIYGHDLAMQHLVAASRLENLEEMRLEVKRIQEDAANGLYGPIPAVLMPAMDRVIETMIRIYGEMDETIADLTVLANDPQGAEQLRNAALWYWRAIRKTESLDRATSDWIEATIAQFEPPPRPDRAKEQIDEIIAILAEASTIERCDFDLAGDWETWGMTAELDHLPGMGSCARLLLADALAKSTNARRDHIEIAFQMIDHLATDRRLASVNASVDIFTLTARAMESDLESTDAAEKNLRAEAWFALLDGAGDAQPFGFAEALAEYRDISTGWILRQHVDRSSDPDAMVAALVYVAKSTSGPGEAAFGGLNSSDLSAILREANRVVSVAVHAYQTQSIAAAREVAQLQLAEFSKINPIAFAKWFVDPLSECAARVEEAKNSLDGLRVKLAGDP